MGAALVAGSGSAAGCRRRAGRDPRPRAGARRGQVTSSGPIPGAVSSSERSSTAAAPSSNGWASATSARPTPAPSAPAAGSEKRGTPPPSGDCGAAVVHTGRGERISHQRARSQIWIRSPPADSGTPRLLRSSLRARSCAGTAPWRATSGSGCGAPRLPRIRPRPAARSHPVSIGARAWGSGYAKDRRGPIGSRPRR